MLGIISCIKHGVSRERSYFIVKLEGDFGTEQVDGSLPFKVGDLVERKEDGSVVLAEGNAVDPEVIQGRIGDFVRLTVKNAEYKSGNTDADLITRAMWPRLRDVAKTIVRKMLVSAPIIVRFHNDADGSGGAYSLYLSARELASGSSLKPNFVWLMQKGVSYSPFDLENDILIANNYGCMEKPLLVLIDFGTNPDSNAGLEKAEGRFDIVWLDHHPLVSEFGGASLAGYINPWQFGGDSNYTAGLLTSVMCRSFSDVDTKEAAGASLIGDYSSYSTSVGQDLSALLDFITSDLQAIFGPGKTNVTPQEIDALITDRDRSRELLEYANMRMDEALDNGVKSIKRYSLGSSNLAVLDFEDIRSEDSKYPLPGRFASKLLDRLDAMGMKRAILVVSVGSYLLMRIDRDLCKDFDLMKILDEMKSRYPDEIAGGGGHRCAGSIKLKFKELGKQMTTSLVTLIRSQLGQHADE